MSTPTNMSAQQSYPAPPEKQPACNRFSDLIGKVTQSHSHSPVVWTLPHVSTHRAEWPGRQACGRKHDWAESRLVDNQQLPLTSGRECCELPHAKCRGAMEAVPSASNFWWLCWTSPHSPTASRGVATKVSAARISTRLLMSVRSPCTTRCPEMWVSSVCSTCTAKWCTGAGMLTGSAAQIQLSARDPC